MRTPKIHGTNFPSYAIYKRSRTSRLLVLCSSQDPASCPPQGSSRNGEGPDISPFSVLFQYSIHVLITHTNNIWLLAPQVLLEVRFVPLVTAGRSVKFLPAV